MERIRLVLDYFFPVIKTYTYELYLMLMNYTFDLY